MVVEGGTYAAETPEEVAEWRKALSTNIAAWKAKHRGLWLERKSKDRELRIAEKGELRSKKHRPVYVGRNQQGQKVETTLDLAEQQKQTVIQRLGELENEMQELELAIEDAEEELAGLPPEEATEPEEGEAAL